MRISILALGSRGDIQPALALAETLASHSHHIRFITHPGFAHLAVGRNVEFLPLAAMKGEFEHLAKKKRYPLFEFRATADMAKRYGLEWSRQFRALAEGLTAWLERAFAHSWSQQLGGTRKSLFSSVFSTNTPDPLVLECLATLLAFRIAWLR